MFQDKNNTPCKDCCFATYKRGRITQVGCELGMIERYKSIGTDVLEAYDEEKEFFVILNRRCPGFRTKAWADRIDKKDRKKMMDMENRIPFHAIIFANEDKTDLTATLNSIVLQEQRPLNITVIRRKLNTMFPSDIEEMLKRAEEDCGYNMSWRIENMLLPMPDDRIVHGVVKSVKLPYHCIFHAGFKLPADYFSSIQKFVMEELGQFGLIQPLDEEGNGIMIPLAIYQWWYFNGDPKITIQENIEKSQCQDKKKIVYTMDEIRKKVCRA